MTEKKPAVDGLSMRMRGKSYIRSETVNKAAPTSMKVRGKSYVGLPLSDQSDAHKGGHLPRRGAGYTGVKQNEQSPLASGAHMTKRGAGYTSLNLAKQAALAIGAYMTNRSAGYTGLKLAQQPASAKGVHMTNRSAGYTGLKLAQQAASAKGPQMQPRGQKYSGTPSALHPYATNSEFRLKIGKYSLKCAKISNLTIAAETEEVPEGGNNLFPNVFLGPRKKADTLVVERALVDDDILSVFKVGVHVGECTLTILRNGEVYKELGFDDGIVTKFELTNLDAMGREIMIHKLEIAHSGLYTW